MTRRSIHPGLHVKLIIPETSVGYSYLHLSTNAKISRHVLGGVTHGNFAVFRLFACRSDFFVERSAETLVAFAERFCSYSNAYKSCYTVNSVSRIAIRTNIDGAGYDLIGDVLGSSQARRTEPSSMRAASSVWKSSC